MAELSKLLQEKSKLDLKFAGIHNQLMEIEEKIINKLMTLGKSQCFTISVNWTGVYKMMVKEDVQRKVQDHASNLTRADE